MIRIKNFNVPFNDQSPINDLVAKRLKLPPQHIDEVVIVRHHLASLQVHDRRGRSATLEMFGGVAVEVIEQVPLVFDAVAVILAIEGFFRSSLERRM